MTSGRVASFSDGLIGQILDGRYEILSLLGKGSMGRVYRAQHTVLHKPLAIKVLQYDPHSAHQLARFRQEAQAASAIGHANIVDVLDFGVLPNNATYFVMEYLDGVSLATFMQSRTQPVPPSELVHIALQVCDGLCAAHRAGIVHRDLKPENVYLISRQGASNIVKLLDFGIAKVAGTRTITQDGQIMGTPAYMSPEQCTGRQVDQRTDIYALGVILYEMASGKVPFIADNWFAMVRQHSQQKPPPLPVGTSLQLSRIVMRCLAKDPRDRYSDMEQVAKELEAIPGVSLKVSASPGVNQDKIQTRPDRIDRRFVRWLHFRAKRFGLTVVVVAALIGLAYAMLPKLRRSPRVASSHVPVSSPSTPASKTTRIDAKPLQALLYRGDELLGMTPQTLKLPTGQATVEVFLKQPGYETHRILLDANTPPELSIMLIAASAEQTNSPGPKREARPPRAPRSKSLEEIQDPWD